MRFIHQVKEHWKAATLHLKRHHKKYIFWILSVSLLVKWISLIAAHTLVHNLSFADTVTWESNNTTINTGTNYTGLDNEIIDNIGWDSEISDNNNENLDENKNDKINITTQTNDINNDENELNTNNWNIGWQTEWESTIWTANTDETWHEIRTPIDNKNGNNNEINNENTNNENDNNENLINKETINDERSAIDLGNWVCDEWDLELSSPIEWNTVWKIFDITRNFVNDDCKDNSYTVRLRNSNEQYLDIFTWNFNDTWFKFNSNQLDSDFFTWYKIAIVSNETEILYRNSEWWEFTIDKKSPIISNIKTEISTKNKKLNIWDTITISFESDEELANINVNILWQSALLEQKRWKEYTYTMDFSKSNTEWKVVYWIDYSDNVWNTWYYEWYENIELDYTKPTISNFEINYKGNDEITVSYTTDEETNSQLIYTFSWIDKINSLDSSGKNYAFTLKNIKKNYTYNYNILIEDEAKNELDIWWTFISSWDKLIFTKKEIWKWELITGIWFKTGEWKEITGDLKLQFNSFGKCSENIDTIKLDLPIKWKTASVNIPKFSNQNINKLTNSFTIALVQKLEKKDLSQKALNEISEDLNNFLIIVKIVKDDDNECKQNMTQYYINRFKKTLIRYWIIQEK